LIGGGSGGTVVGSLISVRIVPENVLDRYLSICVYVRVCVCVCVGAQGGKGGNITTTCRTRVINDWHRRRTSVKDNNWALYIIQDGRVEKFLQQFSYLYIIIRIHVKLRVKCVHRFATVSFFTFRALLYITMFHFCTVPTQY